jgi:hypothetical protein
MPAIPVALLESVGFQRFAEGQIDVDGAAWRAVGRGQGAGGQRAQVAQHHVRRVGRRYGRVNRPADVVAVHLDLVDGLVGPAAAQFRRPVGGQHQQRDVGVVSLNDGRVEVGRGRARRAEQGHRLPRSQGQPQGKETGAALVEVAIDANSRLGGKGQGQRRGARAGGQTHSPQPTAGQLVDEDRCPVRVRIGAQLHVQFSPLLRPARRAWAGTSAPSRPIHAPAMSRRRCPPRRRARRGRVG